MDKKVIEKINCFWKSQETKKYFWGDWLDVRYYLGSELAKYKNKTILDIACQTGIVLNCLDKSNQIYGIDSDDNAIQICKKFNPKANLISGDIFANNFGDNKFDIIILAHVLPGHDYKSDKSPEDLLNLCYQWLKSGGLLYLTTPNGRNSYFANKGKIRIEILKKLLSKFESQIFGWNPFPIQAQKILKHIPGVFRILEIDLKHKKDPEKSVSFYAVAKKT